MYIQHNSPPFTVHHSGVLGTLEHIPTEVSGSVSPQLIPGRIELVYTFCPPTLTTRPVLHTYLCAGSGFGLPGRLGRRSSRLLYLGTGQVRSGQARPGQGRGGHGDKLPGLESACSRRKITASRDQMVQHSTRKTTYALHNTPNRSGNCQCNMITQSESLRCFAFSLFFMRL